MLSSFFGKVFTNKAFIFGYCLLAIGLPFSKILLSLATMWVFLLTLLDLNWRRDYQLIKNNSPLLILLGLLTFHLLSLFWTTNYDYFLHDFNAKLPFYALPIVLVLHPIRTAKNLSFILTSFVTSVIIASLYNFISFYLNRQTEQTDVREMSIYVSHIRFGLMIIFALICVAYNIISQRARFPILSYIIILWLLIYTYYSEVFNAYLTILFLSLISGIWMIFKTYNRKKAFIITGSIFLLLITICFLIFEFFFKVPQSIDPKMLSEKTAEGNFYRHEMDSRYYINNHHVYSNICDKELLREWNHLSKIPLTDTNQFGYKHYFILIQYLSSKGLNKDALGLKKLKPYEIQLILDGQSRYDLKQTGVFRRMETIRNEFYDDNPNDKTLMQRIEFFKAGWHIFLNHPIIGVGSGDIDDAFKMQYQIDKTRLRKENQLRAHNQILSYFISFGLIGGFIFCFLVLKTTFLFFKQSNWLGALFMSMMFFSFLSEDTLETQAGITFFSLFFAIFISFSPINWSKYNVGNRTLRK